MTKYDGVNLHFTAKSGLVLLHGDGLDHEPLRHSEGNSADITTGTVMQVSWAHMKHALINLFSSRPVWTLQQSGVIDESPLI